MESVIEFLHQNGKYKFALPILLVGFGLQYVLISVYLPEFLSYSGGLKNPDQLFSYDLDYLSNLYETLGTKGQEFYKGMLYMDFGYTSISAFGYALLLAALSKQRKWFILLPIGLALFDISENICQLILMNQWPTISQLTAAISSVFTSLKMVLSMASVPLILFFIIRNLISWIKTL